MQTIEEFDFFHLAFDKDGALESAAEFEQMKQRVNSVPATDAVFIAHGFRNDEQDKRRAQHQRRQRFHAAQFGRAFCVAGSVEREGA